MQQYSDNLQKLKENQNYRTLPDASTLQLLDLCSNDYLGINANAKMQEIFWNEVTSKQSFSSCSSRLLGKSLEQHKSLETEIADAFNSEACLLFNSGYHANSGILPALASDKDLIITDKLIHASIIDGAKLSRADFMRYRHLDYNHLENLIKKYRSNYNQVFIVSESIFSMDGDIADLHKLIELKQKYNCLLYIDEAHALGVCGINGLGCAEEQNCVSDVDFIVGTMGKAMASMGAFVVFKQVFKDYLINYSRPFIYSTALPPVNVAWSRFVFQNLTTMKTERQRLKQLSYEFATMLNIKSESHIIPFVIGSNAKAIEKSLLLKQHGFNALPVRYPTVPINTARLRFSLSANMKIEQLKPIMNLLEVATLNSTLNIAKA
jgi:8-amino-7-oxononanoate synthase